MRNRKDKKEMRQTVRETQPTETKRRREDRRRTGEEQQDKRQQNKRQQDKVRSGRGQAGSRHAGKGFDIGSFFVPRSGKKLKTNRYMWHISVVIVVLFIALVGYLVKFTIKDSARIMTSSYNKRNSSLSEETKRGSILSANGKILAYSENNKEGDEIRKYPYENMFAHVVGYSGYGQAGLESVCNTELLTSHENIVKQFKNGVSKKKNTGDNVVTTLDTRLQKAAWEALDGEKGAVIAIEPSTGKVRALVSRPDFDPNELGEIWDEISSDSSESRLLNRATQGLYPPGSTYKVLTALEYMEENPDSYDDFEYDCDGETVVNSVRIHCYEGEEHGTVDLERAFAKSCNTAFVTLGSTLNLKKFASLNQKALFDQSIPFDLNVKKSRFDLDERSDKSEVPQTVIGQGDTLMTPFHNALIMCAVANGGVMMKPYVVDHVESKDGTIVKQTEPEECSTLASASQAGQLQTLLRKVVTEGTGYSLDTDQYAAAGKTGTAENENENAHAWFVGYAGEDEGSDPDLVVCVLVENSGAGSHYAAPIARKIFDSYYNNELKEYYAQDSGSDTQSDSSTSVEE